MEWNVPIHMPAGSVPRARRILVLISCAALLVKVTARIRSGGTPWCWIR